MELNSRTNLSPPFWGWWEGEHVKNVEKMLPKPHKWNNGKIKSKGSSYYIPCACFCELTPNCCGHSSSILDLSCCCTFKLHHPCWILRCSVSAKLQHISQKGTAECQPLYTDKSCCISTLDNTREFIPCYSSESFIQMELVAQLKLGRVWPIVFADGITVIV